MDGDPGEPTDFRKPLLTDRLTRGQRLDRLNAGPAWPPGFQLFVDELDHPYAQSRAGEVVTDLARDAGLPPLAWGR